MLNSVNSMSQISYQEDNLKHQKKLISKINNLIPVFKTNSSLDLNICPQKFLRKSIHTNAIAINTMQ